ncbi:MAG TPA: 4-hydroxy-tetrahydrodipicolinate synthase [Candidatus Polarisedimenticolaceae bacterium]|nr:4-hydroxy-tetrahydrodipicolinate synthase [Candidatus Polarisedimenticolaceae bacterium]
MMANHGLASTLSGAMTALITPFDGAGKIDRAALCRLVAWQVEQGIDALVPCGTTGEAATLGEDEKAEVVAATVDAAAGRVPIIAGCGTNNTRTTVDGAKRCAAAGADALLVVTPYYNKPNASGMLAHYEAVAGATALPVIVYNVPGRTGQNLGVELTLALAEIPGVIGVKEASADLEQIARILAARPPGFVVLSGDDPLALPTVALGAEGVISVVANEAPAEMARLVAHARAGELQPARELHYRLLPLMRANFVESNPVPVKTAMHRLGFCELVLRAPLGPPQAATVDAVTEALRRAAVTAGAR